VPTEHPHSTARLDDVLDTAELAFRAATPPNFQAEAVVLRQVGRAMARGATAGLRAVADAANTLCGAGSSGISLFDEAADLYRSVAAAGEYAGLVGGTSPGAFSPCGITVARGSPQLFARPGRVFTDLRDAAPPVIEGLVVPFRTGDTAGTIWVASHDESRRFTAEDVRLLTGLAELAVAALATAVPATAAPAWRDARGPGGGLHARATDVTLAAITDFAYTFDADGRFVFVNKPLLDLWGLALDQAVGKNFFDLNYPADLATRLDRQIREVFATGCRLIDETPYVSPTGVAGYYEYIFAPVRAADGMVEAVAGSTRDITRRKAADAERDALRAALEAERAKLANVIEQAPAFICTLRGPDHVFEIANERYYEVVGRRDILGKSVRAALPEVEGQGFFELLDRVYETGETFSGDAMPVHLRRVGDGPLERRFMNLVYQPTREPEGRVSGIFVHGVDVTDLVLAREAIRRSEKQFRQLADAMPQIVWAARPDGVLDYYNRRWFEYVDLPPDAAGEAAWDRFIHADDLPRVYGRWADALASGQSYESEFRVRRADGAYRRFLVRALPARDAGGAVVRWYGTCTDVEDHRASQDALRESEERLRLGLRAGKAGTWDWDLPADRVTWSDRIYDIYGVAPGAFGGTVADHARRVHPDDAARVGRAIQDALAGTAEYDTAFRILRPDGEVRWVATTGEVYRGPDGEPLRMVGAAADVTAQKEFELARERLLDHERAARAEAEAANRAKDRHLAFLAHELRGPLTPALLSAAAIAGDATLPPQVRADAALIRRNIELTTRLADDLLDANRIALGKLELRAEPVDAHDLLGAALAMCVADATDKGVRIELDRRAARSVVDGDPAKLTQVWTNLLKNAVKFSHPGGTVAVRTADAAGGRLRVEVRDAGAGVDADLLPRMFDLYEQGDRSVTRQHSGLGLGLSICKGIVDAHGGTITASSEGRGRGTTLTVELPGASAGPIYRAAGPVTNSVAAGPVAGLRILLVDDHEDTLRVMSRLLGGTGHVVTTATGVDTALTAADAGEFDLLISDLGLDDGSGLDLMRELLRRRPIKGIALTGYGSAADVAATRAAGFDAHLTKPVNPDHLQALIRDVAT
jgi:PAS domain S-box-containing protein